MQIPVKKVHVPIPLPKPLNSVVRNSKQPVVARQQPAIKVQPKAIRVIVQNNLQPVISKKQSLVKQIAKPTLVLQKRSVPAVVEKKHKPYGLRRSNILTKPKSTTPAVTRDKTKIIALRNTCIGETLVVIANGPSILEADLQRLKNQDRIKLMTINKPDRRVWPTDYWLFCDPSQQKRNQECLNTYTGTIFTTIVDKRHNVVELTNLTTKGFSLDLSIGLHVGRSSTYTSLQVGLWLGFSHIYLFGVDMCQVTIDGKDMLHYYGTNPDVKSTDRIKRFDEEATHYTHAASVLDERVRKRITFCSSYNRYPFINKFNRLDHKTAVDVILSKATCEQD